MIKLNKLNSETIQIYGNSNNAKVNGFAYKVKVRGNQNKVWHYKLDITKETKFIKLHSNINEGTLLNEKLLLDRIIKEVDRNE